MFFPFLISPKFREGYKRFNRVYREAILDAYRFTDIREVRALTKEWMEEYNQRRPHEALQNQTPSERKQQIIPNLTL